MEEYNPNAEFWARFRELFNGTQVDHRNGHDYSGSSSQNLDDHSVGSSQNQAEYSGGSGGSSRNQPMPRPPTAPDQSLYPEAGLPTYFHPNSIRGRAGFRKEGPGSPPRTSRKQDLYSYPGSVSLPGSHTPETGTEYSSNNQSLQQPTSMIRMAVDFSGSWFLRNALEENNPDFTNAIFDGLIQHILSLVVHPSGCNVLIGLIQVCNVDQLSQIIGNLILPPSRIVQLSLDVTGSKTIRRLIQSLKKSFFIEPVLSALATGFLELMQDQNGAMVIHRCLARLGSQQNEVLYKAAIDTCMTLATLDRGCVELNSFINNVSGPYRDLLLNTITDNTVFLSQDPRGNFVIQHILDLQHPVFTKKICSRLQGYYARLSIQKSGSHVVEKCLKSSDMKLAVLDLVGSKRLAQVALDQFGNYVIQTALKVTQVSDKFLHGHLQKALEPHKEILAPHLHGKNVFKMIKNVVPV